MKKALPSERRYKTSNPGVEKLVDQVIEMSGVTADTDLIREVMITALKIGEDGMERGDIKLINSSMKELRYALKVFYPYHHIRKVALFGSARTPPTDPDYKQAWEFAKTISDAGWMVVTGAASGIMSAGNEGAGREKSFGVNIKLPFEQEANPSIIGDRKLINFKYFFTRKLIFIRETDATVLCPGGFGTHDEGFESLTLIQTGKTSPRPVVCLDPPGSKYWSSMKKFMLQQLVKKGMIDPNDMDLIFFTHSAKTAAKWVINFYHNYHSSRYIGDRFVIRMKRALSTKMLARLNKDFKNIVKTGKIQQYADHFPEEENEPHTHGLYRLSFHFVRHKFARINQLIHEINNE